MEKSDAGVVETKGCVTVGCGIVVPCGVEEG